MRMSSGASIKRREVHNRHVGRDAVVVGGIALRHREAFAAALRRADVVVEARPLAVQPRDQHHRGVVRLLHLRIAEVPDHFVVERPVLVGWRGRRRGGRPAAARTERRQLMARVAAVRGEAALQKRRPGRAELDTGQVRDDAVNPAAAELRRAAVPGRREDDAEVDRPRRGRGVDRGEDAVDAAVRRHRLGGRDPRSLKRDASHRLPDGRRRNRRHERRRGAAGFGHDFAVGTGL